MSAREGQRRQRPPVPAPATPSAPLTRWLKTSTLLLTGVCLLGLFSTEVADTDFWWHLKTGQYIVERHELPVPDPFAVGTAVSSVVVPLIVVAEMFSWYSVLTTSNIGHVVEESIWGLCGTLLVACFILAWPRCDSKVRPLLAAAAVLGLCYVLFMFQVDVPMYWSRWVLDSGHGRQYLSVTQGLVDTSQRWIVSHRWDDWKSEVAWMSLYFSVCVWLSIGLMHAPVRWPVRRAQFNQGYGKLLHE
jgi:hypothetical protein